MHSDLTLTIRALIESQRHAPGVARCEVAGLRISYHRGEGVRDALVIGRRDRCPDEEDRTEARAAIPADWVVAVVEEMPMIRRVRFTIYATRCNCGAELDPGARIFGDGETCSSCLAQRRAGRTVHHA